MDRMHCAATFTLRLVMIKVVVMSQRSTAIQSKYRPELKEFQNRLQEAKQENNNSLSEWRGR